jgi:flagella basal body P-ring formation protein FlgA
MRSMVFAVLLLTATPAAADGARIVVPSHDIKRGDVIGEPDLAYVSVATMPSVAGIATSMNELKGMEARRMLRASEPVRRDDVRQPILVTKGSTVTMTFDVPGVSLTAVGKAMSEGGWGETVTILNPVSYRQITGVVTGAGQVRAGDVMPVASPQQLAIR